MWIVPSTSCPSVPASADSTLPSTWLFRRLARCAGLNGKPTAWRSWRRAWKKAPWLRRLCGRISRPSTARRGVESWIASLAAGPVSHSPWPANGLGRTIRDTFGLTSLESLARFVPDSCLGKTYRGTLLLDSIPFSESFETWATELRRLSLLRRKSAQAIEGSGCLSWPTPDTAERKTNPATFRKDTNFDPVTGEGRHSISLAQVTGMWRTAQMPSGGGANSMDEYGPGNGYLNLMGQAQMWQAVKPPGGGDKSHSGDRKGELLLGGQVQQWSTPCAAESIGRTQSDKAMALGFQETLCGQSKQWQTPHGMGNFDKTGLPEHTTQWPTPAEQMTAGEDKDATWIPGQKPTRWGKKIQTALTTCAKLWRTPAEAEPGINPERLEGGDGHRAYDKETGRLAQYGLTQQSQTWKTPHGMGNFDKEGKVGGAGGGEFAKQANQWPTPNVPNRGPESKQSKATRPDSGGIDLQTEAAQWPTPRSAEYKECGPEGSKSHEHRLDRKYLDATAQSFHPSPPAPASSTNGGESSKSRRRLNPLFVCWLMGFPIGWGHADLNGFGPTAMRSYLCRQRMLLSSLLRRWSEE